MNRLKLVSAAAVLLVAMTAVASPASAGTTPAGREDAACTEGDARAVLEGGWVPGLEDTSVRCRYALFWDGAEVTFCEGDVIAGSINQSVDWSPNGGSSTFSSRDEATALLDEFHHRAWIDGVEQTLTSSSYKAMNFDGMKVVGRITGFIARLPVGDHTSVWEGTFLDFPPDLATVTIHIEPAGSC